MSRHSYAGLAVRRSKGMSGQPPQKLGHPCGRCIGGTLDHLASYPLCTTGRMTGRKLSILLRNFQCSKNSPVLNALVSRLSIRSGQRRMNTSYVARAAQPSPPYRSSGVSLNVTPYAREHLPPDVDVRATHHGLPLGRDTASPDVWGWCSARYRFALSIRICRWSNG